MLSDEEAKRVLREFFAAVLELDGPAEVRRMADVFRCQLQIQHPQNDFSDSTPDGDLNVPLAKAMSNGK